MTLGAEFSPAPVAIAARSIWERVAIAIATADAHSGDPMHRLNVGYFADRVLASWCKRFAPGLLQNPSSNYAEVEQAPSIKWDLLLQALRPPEPRRSILDSETPDEAVRADEAAVAASVRSVRAELLKEVRHLAEQAAAAHDSLAAKHPSGPDKVKADAIRRFAEVFLPNA